jgi:hypothetical protein
MTDATTKSQSAMLARAIGLQDHYMENDGKTGFLLVIDAQTNRVVDY